MSPEIGRDLGFLTSIESERAREIGYSLDFCLVASSNLSNGSKIVIHCLIGLLYAYQSRGTEKKTQQIWREGVDRMIRSVSEPFIRREQRKIKAEYNVIGVHLEFVTTNKDRLVHVVVAVRREPIYLTDGVRL
jgi:hypothetical protein